jgi:hypothetical protein
MFKELSERAIDDSNPFFSSRTISADYSADLPALEFNPPPMVPLAAPRDSFFISAPPPELSRSLSPFASLLGTRTGLVNLPELESDEYLRILEAELEKAEEKRTRNSSLGNVDSKLLLLCIS